MARRTVTVLAAAAISLLALVGPAGAAASSGAGPRDGVRAVSAQDAVGAQDSQVTSGAPKARDRLVFTVAGSGSAAHDGSYTIRCRPSGGDRAGLDAARACAALERATSGGKDPFKPVPSDAVCTMIHGGPATAHVTGTWHGRKVDARFKRINGCEIERWNSLVPALPKTA
ncbi:SSI family serine proteinase inhibitor [Streptomyces axinellae]|uniref:SSI family serine proteinase inhibitor n=1 Tax=Streptomyces axinellae TaxID=552788 RepID=A0ABN3Q489_9ACTN